MELQLLLEDYYAKQEQLRKMTEVLEAETLKVQNVKKLLAVKGIGLITVAGFLAEVGEIGRFDPPNRPGSRPGWNMYPLFQRTHNPQTATGNKLGNNMGDKKALNPRRSRIITEMRNDPDITIAQLRVVLRRPFSCSYESALDEELPWDG